MSWDPQQYSWIAKCPKWALENDIQIKDNFEIGMYLLFI